MDFRRIELHNHSTESDGSLTIDELATYAVQHEFGAMVLTDHNTTSGHTKLDRTIHSRSLPLEALHGLELTTYKGHILCLDLEEYIPWSDINPKRPEILFDRVRAAGGLVGVAHPFSMGAPLSTGCEWVMEINDYSRLDFIEVVNNSADLPMINALGQDWWQQLVLQGHRLAATSGIDLHRRVPMDSFFTTYLPVPQPDLSLSQLLRSAITNQQTVVTRGPVFYGTVLGEDGKLQEHDVSADEGEKQQHEEVAQTDGLRRPRPLPVALQIEVRCDIDNFTRRYAALDCRDWVIELITPSSKRQVPCRMEQESLTFNLPLEPDEQQASVLILKLHERGAGDALSLLALAPPIWLK